MKLKPLQGLGIAFGVVLFADFGSGTAAAQFAPVARPGYMPNPFPYQRSVYRSVAPRWAYPIRPYVRPYAYPYAVPVPVYVPVAGAAVGTSSETSSGGAAAPQPATGYANIRITLPAPGASISINGADFGPGVGYDRNLTVPFIEDGRSHNYRVSATWKKDGKTVSETRTVTVKASGNALANFLIPGQ